MRGWLENYYSKIFPMTKINLSKGYDYDSPIMISKEIFKDD
jgi:hypothetical protein